MLVRSVDRPRPVTTAHRRSPAAARIGRHGAVRGVAGLGPGTLVTLDPDAPGRETRRIGGVARMSSLSLFRRRDPLWDMDGMGARRSSQRRATRDRARPRSPRSSPRSGATALAWSIELGVAGDDRRSSRRAAAPADRDAPHRRRPDRRSTPVRRADRAPHRLRAPRLGCRPRRGTGGRRPSATGRTRGGTDAHAHHQRHDRHGRRLVPRPTSSSTARRSPRSARTSRRPA